ncbi:hypothetical protein M0805_006195 [Coniferiporia weirii]|nr:hypothetical protein M0805_006195 [Coniferiporia weirii]
MVARFALTVAAVAGIASAQLQVLAPGGPNLWWVAESANNIVWNCNESQVNNFTVLIANSNPDILVSAEAIVGIQENFDCSETLTTQQVNFTAATGYTIILANPLNSTDVYATSAAFEIKPLGSTYPATSATPVASSTGAQDSNSGSSTASGSGSPAATSKSGALPVLPSGAGAFSALLAGAFALLAL